MITSKNFGFSTNLMVWMDGNEEVCQELRVEEQVAEEPALVRVRNRGEHIPDIES